MDTKFWHIYGYLFSNNCAKFYFSISPFCNYLIGEIKGGNNMPPLSGWRVARRPSDRRVNALNLTCESMECATL